MIPLSEYISEKTIPFLIGVASAIFSFGIVNVGCLIAIKKKIKAIRVLLMTFCFALLLVLPQFLLEYLLFYPATNESSNVFLAALVSLPNPFLLFLYYFFSRRLLGLSRANAFRILEPTILLQYIILTMFQGMGRLWGSLLSISFAWPHVFNSQMLAMLTTDMLAVAVLFFIRDLYGRRGKYIEIPYGYPVPDTGKELRRIFLSVSCHYIILAAFRVLILFNRPDDNSITYAVLYFTLVGVLLYRLFEFIKHRRLSIIEWQAAATDDYIRSLVTASEEFRSLKHDFNNILQIYGGYITSKDLDGLQQYHESTVKTATRVGTSLDIIDSLLPRKAIYTLFGLKAQLAREHDVDMKIIQPGSLIRVAMNDLDLCRVMANLIDNAIDAAAESADKKVVVECLTMGKTTMNLIISNSTAATVNIGQIGQGGSTKPNHMGHGLATVRNIIALHEGCSISLDFEHSMFIARVFLVTDS